MYINFLSILVGESNPRSIDYEADALTRLRASLCLLTTKHVYKHALKNAFYKSRVIWSGYEKLARKRSTQL